MLNHTEDPRIDCDVVLIGAGVMSATLGVLLKELQPDLKIEIFERLDKVAAESSDPWNNAGTGHSALCELNYTPEKEDGTIDVSKAIKILESFEISKQFWSYLTQHGYFNSPHEFINSIPHISVVWGEKDVAFLRKRFEALQSLGGLFEGMEYSDDPGQLKPWFPLIMEGRQPGEKMAATRIALGTDVNFGALTKKLLDHLQRSRDVEVFLSHEVRHLDKTNDGLWHIDVRNLHTHQDRKVSAKFVFIGAGGGSLPLLEKSHIQEGKGFGGFPISGQWLICKNPAVIEKHQAKAYGKASVGAPPMSVPHLDTRIVDGKKALLFGPYAGFTTKFLKEGSVFDLTSSIRLDNLGSLFGAWVHNLPLTKYLIEQVAQSENDKMEALRQFVPTARDEDWELAIAGQRVQVIKKDAHDGGILEFGTEVVTAADGSIAALLGASPGASTAVSIMLELMHRCFKDQMESPAWRSKLEAMIPSYGKDLFHHPELVQAVRKKSHEFLQLAL